jgi:hypothetical protein
VTERIAFHQQRADRIHQALASEPRTVFQLVQALFRSELAPVHLFLALSEIQGHLDLLVHQGRAKCLSSEPAGWWQIT